MRTFYFTPVVPSSSFFCFPRLVSAVADWHWMTTIFPHMMWLYCEFTMQVWNVLHAARWKYKKTRKKSPSANHRTNLSSYIFAIKAFIDKRKKPVKRQYLLNMSSQYGELRPTNGIFNGTPAYFNGFRVLLLHRHRSTGVNQALQVLWVVCVCAENRLCLG